LFVSFFYYASFKNGNVVFHEKREGAREGGRWGERRREGGRGRGEERRGGEKGRGENKIYTR
jgi:hypothetical protein